MSEYDGSKRKNVLYVLIAMHKLKGPFKLTYANMFRIKH